MVLLALDVRAVIELWVRLYSHRHSGSIERLSGGDALYWGTWLLVVLFDLGVLWLTIHIGRRMQAQKAIAPSS
jgi:hypothetical protein